MFFVHYKTLLHSFLNDLFRAEVTRRIVAWLLLWGYMAGILAKQFYGSPAWKQTRRAYMKSVGGLCERCMANGIVKPAEVVHHKKPINEKNVGNANVTLSWNNLQALCAACHAEVHDEIYRERTGRRYKIEKNGHVVIV